MVKSDACLLSREACPGRKEEDIFGKKRRYISKTEAVYLPDEAVVLERERG